MSMRRFCISFFLVLLSILSFGKSLAYPQLCQEPQGLQVRSDSIQVSLMVADPGRPPYSIFGHVCIRLVCKDYDFDCCYSCESKNVPHKVWRYLTNSMVMGWVSIPTSDFLQRYSVQSRQVKEYPLSLTIEAKQKLWIILEEKAQKGFNMPYDFIIRGCAYSCLSVIEQAVGEESICYPVSSGKEPTRREALDAFARHSYPWQLLLFHTVVGIDIDRHQNGKDNIMLPCGLIVFLQQTFVDGQPLLSGESCNLLPTYPSHRQTVTPLMVVILLLLISLLSRFVNLPWWQYVILGLVTVIGTTIVYLVCFTTIPGTQWNQLIVPFNCLPAIAWRWRKYWSRPYAIIIVLWIIAMIAVPQQLTDPAHLILALSWAIVLFRPSE